MRLIRVVGVLLFLAVAALAWGGPGRAHAGAWTLKAGTGQVFLSGFQMRGDAYYDRQGRLRKRDDFTKTELQVFAEYGVNDRVTVFGATALQRIDVQGVDRDRREGLGRTELGARVRLHERDGWVASAQTSIVIAGARKGQGVAAVGEFDDQLDMRGLVARSFAAFGLDAFVDVQAGYRLRASHPTDEIRLDVAFGIRPARRWLLLAQSFNTLGVGEWRGPYPLRQRIHKLQAGAVYDLTARTMLHAAVFATPWARDALNECGAVVGLGYRF